VSILIKKYKFIKKIYILIFFKKKLKLKKKTKKEESSMGWLGHPFGGLATPSGRGWRAAT
jgi:hypothetical protein